MYQRRLQILTVCFCVGFLLVQFRLAHLQLFRGHEYRGLAQRQPIRERLLPTTRGRVLDVRGRVLAAEEPTYELCVRPDRLSQLPAAQQTEWLTRVAQLLERGPEELSQAYARLERDLQQHTERPGLTTTTRARELRRLRQRFQPLLDSLTFPQVARLESWRDTLPRSDKATGDALRLRVATRRIYPYGDSASHLIGYLTRINAEEAPGLRQERRRLAQAYAEVDPDRFRDAYLKCYLPDDSRGRRGLEGTWEWTLRGRRGLRREMVDARGRAKKTLFDYPPQPGSDIHTTLDIDLQRLAESALAEKPGAVVILDVFTGAVLAMASSPRLDLGNFSDEFGRILSEDALLRRRRVPFYRRPRPLTNRATQETYAPGSVFKLATALAALRAGTLGSQTIHDCRGSILVGNRSKQCLGFHGPLDLRAAIERSCNVYFYQTALATPRAELLRTARDLGFGSRTGIDLPGESPGTLPRLRTDGEVANFAIGQGDLQVTPLQVAVMVAVIANGGTVVQPHLVKRPATPKETRQLDIPPGLLQVVRRGMRDVVHGSRGTARRHGRVPGMTIAGKTGTAEVEGVPLNHAWFAGFAPYQEPRIAFAVVVEWTEGQGGDTAAPVAAEILSHLRFRPQSQAVGQRAPVAAGRRHGS